MEGEAGEAGRGQSVQDLGTTMERDLWQDSGRRTWGRKVLGSVSSPPQPTFVGWVFDPARSLVGVQ